jgi:hypothetical protein
VIGTAAFASLLSAGRGASIPQLFAALPSGTPGLCYRYADTRFNSAARNGSTGFGASSGPLGLVLDQRFGALDALGPNLLTNGTFDADTNWSKGPGWTISGGVASKSLAAASNIVSQFGIFTNGRIYEISFEILNYVSGSVLVFAGIGSSDSQSGLYSGNGRYSVFLRGSVSPANFYLQGNAAFVGSVDNISVREIPGTHAHALSDAVRPTLGGFAGGSTLAAIFNGTNSAMQTVAPLDMSSTDEVTVIAVVRSLANAASIIAEPTVGAGSWNLQRTGANTYLFVSLGSGIAKAAATGAIFQPDNAVFVCRAKINQPIVGIRRNSGGEATNIDTQGSGNYNNQMVNVGCRNAASPSFFFNGHIAALCIVGRQPSNLPSGWLETMTGLLVPRDATFT